MTNTGLSAYVINIVRYKKPPLFLKRAMQKKMLGVIYMITFPAVSGFKTIKVQEFEGSLQKFVQISHYIDIRTFTNIGIGLKNYILVEL